MEIGEQRLGNLVVVQPEGRIDNTTSAEFQARLLAVLQRETADIVVDFSAVEYISSAGLRAKAPLISLSRRARMMQPPFQMRAISARFRL